MGARLTPPRRSRPRERAAEHNWARWSDDALLRVRLCDLHVSIEGSWLEEPIAQLYEELSTRGIRVRPHVWLSNEWFCPDEIPGIAMPFYLAHPRLIRLERKQMLEVEGGVRSECLKLLRHEAGHAVEHAFGLHRRKRWREVFGSVGKRYPEYYRPNPASRRFVNHLDLWYAQSHPYEDFAETFAVWLAPRSQWRRRYAGWPARKKLEYVDELMKELAGVRPKLRSRRCVDPLPTLRQTLGEYYAEKRERYAASYPADYDRELSQIFTRGTREGRPASAFLRRHSPEIRRMVARWTGEYQFTLDVVLNDMIGRCRELKLRAVGDEAALKLDFAILLTAKTMHYVYRNREWHAL